MDTLKLWRFSSKSTDELVEVLAYSRMEAWQEFQDMGFRDTSGWSIGVQLPPYPAFFWDAVAGGMSFYRGK